MPGRLCLLCCVAIAAVAAAEPPRAKDEREYALVQRALAEKDVAKRLETLRAWTDEYAHTDLAVLRAQLYLRAFREASDTPRAIGAAERVLALEPDDFGAHYALASLAPVSGAADEPALRRAEQAARSLLESRIEARFHADNRPPEVSAEAWHNAARQARAASLRTLGWVAMQRSRHAAAEARLVDALGVEPASAQTSYWLAQSIMAQRDPEKNEAAFFSLARAAVLTGPGELPEASREQIHAYLRKVYRDYAGTLDGLQDFERLATEHALPPRETPRVLSEEQRKAIEEEAFCEQRPLECAYRRLREGLDGEGVWTDLQGKRTPRMRLYVVANEPPERPLALRLAPTKDGRAEVLLRLANRRRSPLPRGTLATFEGVATSLRRQPFLLTLEQGRLVE